MDNEQRASNLLNVFASKETEQYVIGGNKGNLKLLGKYVVRLSAENANHIYVEFMCCFYFLLYFSVDRSVRTIVL